MADRTVSVKLTSDTGSYISGLRQAETATNQLATTGGTNFRKLGGDMENVGRKMSLGVTLPVLGAGAAAVQMGNTFDSVFGQMVGLAGVPAGEVDMLKEAVLDLAGETARAPVELAEGLYFAASAGLDSAQALDAVKIAARAAAAGMGSTQDIVGLAASAVASYGAANITSAEAVDILTSSIREGRAEPAELAGSLGRVLPIAASLGVGLAEVGGTVAYLSNIFGDTDRTVTSVNDAFAKLAAPTDGARQALEEAGTSADELHRVIGQDGLLAGLDLLREHGFAGNSEAIRKLMPDMQGAAALTALLDDASGSLADTLGAVENSTGSLEVAYQSIDEDAQRMKQSWVDIQVALIRVGDIVGPIVADLLGGAADLAQGFGDLPEPVQKLVIAAVALVAVAGPLLMVTGSLMKNFATMKTTLSGSSGLVGAVGGVTAAITVATAVYVAYAAEKQRAIARTNEFADALSGEAGAQEEAVNALLVAEFSQAKYADTLEHLGVTVADVVRAVKGEQVPALDDLTSKSNRAQFESQALARDIGMLELAIRFQTKALEDGAEQANATSSATNELGRETAMYTEFAAAMRAELVDNTTATVDLGDKAANAGIKIGDLARYTDIMTEAAAAERAELEQLTVRYNEQVAAIDELLGRKLDLIGGDIAVRQAQRDAREAADELNTAIAEGTIEFSELGPAIDSTVTAQLAAAQSAADYRADQMEANGTTVDARVEAQLLKEELLRLADNLDGPVRDAVLSMVGDLDNLARDRNANINFHITSSGLRIATNGALAIGGNVPAVSAAGVIATSPTFTAIAENEPEVVIPLSKLRASNTLPGNAPLPANIGNLFAGGNASSTIDQRTAVHIDTVNDYSGDSIDTAFRTANTLMTIGG